MLTHIFVGLLGLDVVFSSRLPASLAGFGSRVVRCRVSYKGISYMVQSEFGIHAFGASKFGTLPDVRDLWILQNPKPKPVNPIP